MQDRDLVLPEEILLLILDDATGEKRASYVGYLTAGAGFAELAYKDAIRVEGEGRKARYVSGGTGAVGHPYLDALLTRLQEKDFSRKPSSFVTDVGGKDKKYLSLLLDGLVDRGIVRRVTKKALGIFPYSVYPTVDPTAEQNLRDRLEAIMFRGENPEPHDAVLIALALKANVLRRNFDRELLRLHKTRIKSIAEEAHLSAKAAAQAIDAMNAAIVAGSAAVVVAT